MKQDAVELARRYFNLTLPTSTSLLKSAYRRESRRLHPDLNPHGEEEFKGMQLAYEYLTSSSVAALHLTDSEGSQTIKKTVSGIPLFELGLGIDPRKNAKDCPTCNRKGYTVHTEAENPQARHFCPDCEYHSGWSYSGKCKACNGTGRFKLKSGREVECRVCKGSGVYRYRKLHHCETCKGTGFILKPRNRHPEEYHMCNTCSGTGELEVFNPVLPKNLFG